jgi:hypothetical protein
MLNLESSPKTLELFAENYISTNLYERDIAIAPDGNEIIYTLGNYKQTCRVLISIKKENGIWSDKKIVSFSGEYQDIEPFISTDGKRLFFASNRPINNTTNRTDYNIWVSEKINSKWSNPKVLDTIINSKKDEFYPSVTRNGNLYFTTSKENGIGKEDIFLSEFINGKYQNAKALNMNINSKSYEFNAYISPDETLIIFSSYGRKDGFGGSDLYYSKKDKNGQWQPSKNMGEKINSNKLDYCPFIDYKNNNFYFTSERFNISKTKISSVKEFNAVSNQALNGMGNLFRISLEQLDLD